MNRSRPFLILAFLVTLTGTAQAQETTPGGDDDAEVSAAAPVQEPEEAPDRWLATLDLGLNAATGNSRLAVISTTLRIKHLQTQTLELDWAATYRYGESRGDVVARNINSSLNLNVQPRATVSPYAFATVEHDVFRRLELRSNTGSGIMYTLYRRPSGTASLSLAGLYSHESFTTDQPTRTDARLSVQGKLDRRFGSKARFETSGYFKPVWDHGRDYNIQVQSKFSSKITERLAMTFSHEYLHDSTPPDGVAREDMRFQAGATIEFF